MSFAHFVIELVLPVRVFCSRYLSFVGYVFAHIFSLSQFISLLLYSFFFFFWLCHTACRILVPPPGFRPPAAEALSPSRCTAREAPRGSISDSKGGGRGPRAKNCGCL